jgi:hypothetical protein
MVSRCLSIIISTCLLFIQNDGYLEKRYLYNTKIVDAINELDLKPGIENISDNLRFCYQKLIDLAIISDSELTLLDNWLEDIKNLC